MRGQRINEDDHERRYCRCEEVQLCSCINHPPCHCGLCGRELTAAQLAEARRKGWYQELSKSSD
jgi:hypothetical protein